MCQRRGWRLSVCCCGLGFNGGFAAGHHWQPKFMTLARASDFALCPNTLSPTSFVQPPGILAIPLLQKALICIQFKLQFAVCSWGWVAPVCPSSSFLSWQALLLDCPRFCSTSNIWSYLVQTTSFHRPAEFLPSSVILSKSQKHIKKKPAWWWFSRKPIGKSSCYLISPLSPQNFEDIEETADQPKNEKVRLEEREEGWKEGECFIRSFPNLGRRTLKQT